MIENPNEQQNNNQNKPDELVDHTKEYTSDQIKAGKLMSVLSYLSVLSLIPYFTEKTNPYVKFHAKQGINIFLYEVIFYALDAAISKFSSFFGFIAYLGSIALGVASIVGIVFALNGEAKEIPFLNQIKLIK